MFQLVLLRDVINIPPHRLDWELTRNLRDQLAIKYSNKVVHNIGLVICLFDIIEMSDPFVLPGQPDVVITLEFRIVVFRPFIGEVLSGKVFKSTQDGVYVHVDFFHDILIAPPSLPSDSEWHEECQAWAWRYQTAEETHDLYIEEGEEIRFAITNEVFKDITADLSKGDSEDVGTDVVPYMLHAHITEAGLGMLSWWN